MVRVIFYGALRDALGAPDETLSGDVLNSFPLRLSEVLELLRTRGGCWEVGLSQERLFRVAINGNVAARSASIHDGDEVVIFSPVTGG